MDPLVGVPPDLPALIVAVSLGALIGLVRQWEDQQGEPDATREPTAGLRTASLWAMLGFLLEHLARGQAWFLPVGFAAVALALGAAMAFGKPGTPLGGFGLTHYASALVTVIVGVLVGRGETLFATVVAALLALVIAAKGWSHGFTRELTRADLRIALQFVAVSGIILPLVPDQGYGPGGALNPYKIWWLVVLISGLGFVGYAANRVLGSRAGVAVTGFVGGLASSTATTLAFAKRSREEPALAGLLGPGIVAASVVMFGRILALLAVVAPPLAASAVAPFAAMALPALAVYGLALRRHGGTGPAAEAPAVGNPLRLRVAIQFALLYAVIVMLVKLVPADGASGTLWTVAFVSGLTDMDAIALSLADSTGHGLALATATVGLVLAALANTLFKLGLALGFGHRALRGPVATGFGAMVAGGVAWLAFVLLAGA